MTGEVLSYIINIISPIATIILSVVVFVRTIKVDKKKEHLEAPPLIVYNFVGANFVQDFKEKLYKPQAIYWMDTNLGPFVGSEVHRLSFQKLSASECIEEFNNHFALYTGLLFQNFSKSPLYIDSMIDFDQNTLLINHTSISCLENNERVLIFCKRSLQPKRISGMFHGVRIYYDIKPDEPISIIIPKE